MPINENFLLCPDMDSLPRIDPPLRIGVMASGNGSNFEALVESTLSSSLNAKVELLVVNNECCFAIDRAKRLGIKYLLHDHRDYVSRHELDKALIQSFKEFEIECIVMAGWMRVVTPTLINSFNNRIINIHPSILPSFPGLNAIDKALAFGVKVTGCTVHIVSAEVDSGPILAQAVVPIFEHDNKQSLRRRIQEQEHKILPIGVAVAAERWRLEDLSRDNMC
ncbi:phosphoribosylglycinamide formyltransferase [Prochlorococcus sp. MIT 1300]|uniref:phosphoribosylglycinamide formyltransferase n=1 Tax=Prochlorococcus sp. MIT 1300 TaxID=3096218 RepID=UPI002A74BEE5|nr:phosphoribosylglycinamide formyltransferase [Prochlorococcus sp. MIT 1300]